MGNETLLGELLDWRLPSVDLFRVACWRNHFMDVSEMTEHKHAEVLRAIADGKEVECRPKGYYGNADWFTTMNIINPINPITRPDYEWRVKPEPKPDFKTYLTVRKGYMGKQTELRYAFDTVCFTFDGETGNLKSVEMLE